MTEVLLHKAGCLYSAKIPMCGARSALLDGN